MDWIFVGGAVSAASVSAVCQLDETDSSTCLEQGDMLPQHSKYTDGQTRSHVVRPQLSSHTSRSQQLHTQGQPGMQGNWKIVDGWVPLEALFLFLARFTELWPPCHTYWQHIGSDIPRNSAQIKITAQRAYEVDGYPQRVLFEGTICYAS